MICESMNLKGVEYKPKQNSSSLQSFSTCTCFGNIGPIFYKDHSLIDNNKVLQSTWETGVANARLEFSGKVGAPNELLCKKAVLQWVFCWEN